MDNFLFLKNLPRKRFYLLFWHFLKTFWGKKKYHNFRRHFRSKILLNKRLSNLKKKLTHNYQIPYSKNFKVWTKLNNFLLNKIFVPILILFLWIRPYMLYTLGDGGFFFWKTPVDPGAGDLKTQNTQGPWHYGLDGEKKYFWPGLKTS